MIQGTEQLTEFAATLRQRSENIRAFFDHAAAARDLLECAEIIERLAQYEPDLQVEQGEN